ncbi:MULTISPECIES: TonB-dependent siderophore receptor [unclassified Caulobacter]|uniref:TonB-dependent receptor plug domain-containing protein n=1 Tax=unclassified Caulobacter TaxID=2648921 RepID=UPI0007861F5C|nr:MULTISPECIES: TonB-dependent receptor [unclassified Caulobacter]AZS21259.1 TonB-dependent receptor [Caulobacter sp. FWC26]
MRYKTFLLAAVSVASIATMAQAQTARDTDQTSVEELVVTGTRTAGRSRLDTVAPVDVVSEKALTRTGTTELAQSLSTLAPSINFPRPAITDGTDHIRPATLRGLAPDQTLVLVNGARRHSSALVNVNGSIGRGSAAVDLNAIPTIALDRVEVLRDGASAQYGSDAIAGVINLRLREARSGGGATITYGGYNTLVKTARNTDGRRERDGETVTVQAWQGLPLGPDGFLTVSAEYRDRNPTSRGDIDNRVTPARVTSRYGDAEVKDKTVYLNAGLPVGSGWEAYGWAGYQTREGGSAAFPRIVGDARQTPVASIYPNGYLPIIATDIEDSTAAFGLKGDLAGFKVDLNVVYGKNKIDYRTESSANASYGAASQTSFNSGGMTYDQTVVGLDVSRGIDIGAYEPLNVAFGAEARWEGYSIRAGEPTSYNRGPITTAAAGAQGFPGFQPSNVLSRDRDNIGLYLDLESRLTERFTASAAIRYEDYSDFGATTTGKLAARYELSDGFAIRGAASTGFRAPALQQQFFTTTSTNFIIVNGVSTPVEVGTFPATSAVAKVLGAKPLEAEKSNNYSAGLVFHRGPFELTVDAYQIKIDNRIVLSENIQGSATGTATATAIYNLLAPFNVTAARFFLNGVDTKTKGVDVVARYRIDDEQAGRFDLTAAANFNKTDVTKLPTTNTISSLPVPPSLFARANVLTFEEGTPKRKITLAGDWSREAWGATLKTTFYGSVLSPNNDPTGAFDVRTGAKAVVDLEGRYAINERVNLAIGANNLFDEYPNRTPANINTTNATAFTGFSPFGFNGRFFYGRVSVNW